jgi:hypothetical protein
MESKNSWSTVKYKLYKNVQVLCEKGWMRSRFRKSCSGSETDMPKKVRIRNHNTGHKVGEGEQKAALNFKKGRRELGNWD